MSTSCRPTRPPPGITAASPTSRPLEQFLRGRPQFRARPLCRGASAGQCARRRGTAGRSRRSWRASPAFRPTIFSPTTCASIPTGSARSCCATSARSSAASTRAIPAPAGPGGAGADYDPQARRSPALGRRDQRLSVSRPRLQDAADLPAEQLRRSSAACGISSTRARMVQQLSPTPASISPRRCARTRS